MKYLQELSEEEQFEVIQFLLKDLKKRSELNIKQLLAADLKDCVPFLKKQQELIEERNMIAKMIDQYGFNLSAES